MNEPKKKGWRICIDFDGVINSYKSGYKPNDDTFLPDPPVEGAREFLLDCKEAFHEVFILSARCQTLEGMLAIVNYMKKWDLPLDIPITFIKYPAEVYVDDRGYTFTGAFPNPWDLVGFRTWVNNSEQEETDKWVAKTYKTQN